MAANGGYCHSATIAAISGGDDRWRAANYRVNGHKSKRKRGPKVPESVLVARYSLEPPCRVL